RQQDDSDAGPEYLVQKLGDYVRWYRGTQRQAAVTMAERALLDVYCSTFEAFAAAHPHLLIEEPPPRYRARSRRLLASTGASYQATERCYLLSTEYKQQTHDIRRCGYSMARERLPASAGWRRLPPSYSRARQRLVAGTSGHCLSIYVAKLDGGTEARR